MVRRASGMRPRRADNFCWRSARMAGFTREFFPEGMEAMIVTAAFCAAVCMGMPYRLAANENFSVYAPSRVVAEQILEDAERHRRDIGKDWFGRPLPDGVGRTLIHVTAQPKTDRGEASLANGNPSAQRNLIWISTESFREPQFTSTLKHEITHCLLAAKFPQGLPVWVHEGCASQCDSGLRRRIHQQTIQRIVRTGQWPKLETILGARRFDRRDREAYGLAVSLAEFLIDYKDQSTLLAFGADCHAAPTRTDAALKKHYRIRSIAELQTRWQAWAAKNSTVLAARP